MSRFPRKEKGAEMTRIGILGYGNLGRGVELAVRKNEDQTLVGVFTRRNPQSVKTALDSTKVYSADDLPSMQGEIDVLVICGGSATDLPEMTPKYARLFNVVDSFDTHARIPEHFENVNRAASSSLMNTSRSACSRALASSSATT